VAERVATKVVIKKLFATLEMRGKQKSEKLFHHCCDLRRKIEVFLRASNALHHSDDFDSDSFVS
jgi:hypothetical protein